MLKLFDSGEYQLLIGDYFDYRIGNLRRTDNMEYIMSRVDLSRIMKIKMSFGLSLFTNYSEAKKFVENKAIENEIKKTLKLYKHPMADINEIN